MITGIRYLDERLAHNSLVQGVVIAMRANQSVVMHIERVVRRHPEVPNFSAGDELTFIQSPGHFADPTLSLGDHALVFLQAIHGKIYEHPWRGHMPIELVSGMPYVILPAKTLIPRGHLALSPLPSSVEGGGVMIALDSFYEFLATIACQDG